MSLYSHFERKLEPFPPDEPPVPSDSFFSFVWGASKGARGFLLCMSLFSALVGLFEALLFAALGRVVDLLAKVEPAGLWAEHSGKLLALAAIILGSVILVAVQALLQRQTLGGNFPVRLRWNFHRLMLRQSMNFFQDEFAGRVTTKVMQTAQALRDFYMVVTDILVYALIYFATMAATLGWFDPWLLLPFGLWLAGYILALRRFVPRLASASRSMADARSTMVGRVTDAYTNIATVKLFAHAGREADYSKNAMREFLQAVQTMLRRISSFEILNHLLSMLLILGAGAVALRLWMLGQAGIGALAAVGAMAMRLSGMSHWIMWESTQLFEHVGTIHDGMRMLARRRAVVDAPDATRLAVSRGDIRFENVSFSYAGQGGPLVISDFSLHIRPGEKIGLIGRSGAGKSTLVSLLLRFHDLTAGRILIDGRDIAGVAQESLRAGIGMVMQDTSLLHRSVRDNILYGRQEATEDDMRAAARRAEAAGFIEGLADPKGRTGYDAHVGERGVKLSGGQRQRIAIARVMLKDAPILLLDEATSALDSEVETAIQENLYRLMEGKTVVAIAHRLSTIAALDRLVVLEAGRIVEEGPHAELLARGGLYARLWNRQSGGFLAVEDEVA